MGGGWGWVWGGFGDGFGGAGLHFDSVAQFAIFSTAVAGWDASNDVRFDSRQITKENYDGSQR